MNKMCAGNSHYFSRQQIGSPCRCGKRTWGETEQRQWERFMDRKTIGKGITNG